MLMKSTILKAVRASRGAGLRAAILLTASAALMADGPAYFKVRNLDPVPHRIVVTELRRENGSSALTHEVVNPQRVHTYSVEIPARGVTGFLPGFNTGTFGLDHDDHIAELKLDAGPIVPVAELTGYARRTHGQWKQTSLEREVGIQQARTFVISSKRSNPITIE